MTKLCTFRQVFIALLFLGISILLIKWYIFESNTDQSYLTSSNIKIGNEICRYSKKDLSSLVWSHRAHYNDKFIDGSQFALWQLLNAGIRGFDVDVSCKKRSDGSCDFVVAHPSTIASEKVPIIAIDAHNDVQTVNDFLLQLHEYFHNNHDGMHPTVTLEMKFYDLKSQLAFIRLVQQSPLAEHVAIIGADPHTLSGIVSQIHRGGIAAAYRTKPLTDHDYHWPTSTSTVSETLTTDKHQLSTHLPLLIQSEYSPSTTLRNSTLSTQVLTLPHNTAIHSFLQIYMPDIKLLTHPIIKPIFSPIIEISTKEGRLPPTKTGKGNNILVVAWVVDDLMTLWDAVTYKGVDAVISNRPVQLLQLLQDTHDQYCN